MPKNVIVHVSSTGVADEVTQSPSAAVQSRPPSPVPACSPPLSSTRGSFPPSLVHGSSPFIQTMTPSLNDNTSESYDLPPFRSLTSKPAFTWGSLDGATFTKAVEEAYHAVVQWKNLFKVPFGKIGKEFVSEMSRLFYDYANDSELESVALKTAMIMPSLLLQRLHCCSKCKENSRCLERRMALWVDGNVFALLWESQSIQDHFKPVWSSHMRKDCNALTSAN